MLKSVFDKVIATKTVWLTLLAYSVLGSLAFAQNGGTYTLESHTIDAGGGRSSGGDYALTGTIGQHDAAYSQADNYELLGGFWPGGPLCTVAFDDFARFAVQWRNTGVGLTADLSPDQVVDEFDLKLFIIEWLYECPYGWPLK